MAMTQTRRRMVGGMALAIPTAVLFPRRAATAEPPPETTMLRIPVFGVTCLAPQYVAEEFLYAEGFTHMHFLSRPSRNQTG